MPVPSNPFSLVGRVAFVTGGNSGIGRALALAMHEAGAKVAIGGRRADRNAAVLAEIGNRDNAAAFELDVCDEVSVERTVGEVMERFGRIDILVNNAGGVNRKSVLELDRGDWDRVLAVNLTGPFLCTKHAARHMKAQGGGKIINIASVYGLIAPSKGLQVAYTASKHGVIGLTRVNAVELMPFGIQVNAIAPGYFFTEMTGELRGTSLEQAIKRRTPSGTLGETSELIGTCIYLASAASDHVSGVCIPVDGGYLASDGLERG
ncbi:MAG TPA: 3-oxoacyl-ACP reductase family protein [Burkholderiales bacterium]|nr:3-oxoacyl-ACP reductase family protein [Burkholderiales bacterium]